MAATALVVFATIQPAAGATLLVGPNQTYREPSDAARVASSGDTIRIAAGTYKDCAVWTADKLTIEGAAEGTVLSDQVCEDKAIFVIHANDVTVRNITFAHARVQDGNGAGIRAEGANLTVENSKFLDNQDGILAGSDPGSSILVRGSEFDRNGACVNACAHGIYVGHIALLRIEHSRFFETRIAHHIKSRAARTELIDNQIEDGPDGTSSYLVDIPNGGSLLMVGNVLEKGPRTENPTAAIMLGEEGSLQATPEILIRNNAFTNDGPPTAFVKNMTVSPAQLIDNTVQGHGVKLLVGEGAAP